MSAREVITLAEADEALAEEAQSDHQGRQGRLWRREAIAAIYPSAASSCHDAVTTTCFVCDRSFAPIGRQRYCSGACRAAAYRARRGGSRPSVVVPRAKPRRPVTVYQCDSCGVRALGEQYCAECSTFMSKVGIGGLCPSCGEAVSITELGHEVTQ